ncbi:FAD-dependent oxidoreductase [Synechococcus sp. RSCCF101]|uniref:FAD-dependent oxidoreductase n=1 Tax=Synechococcus sp. RSCCF101 TaxID=2511069 RepID=UPI0012466221|nr:FAD-dependent oxidoreductase [Synechococcus sp. RSCCF101]QEY31743.1 FAD-dependent oxidoreductase [Synechococcus sp. RSCCF101]
MAIAQAHVPVVVWGGGTGGVAAALQAARMGAATCLLTPGSWLGGMVSAAGVTCPDGNELSCWQTGLWGAFLRALRRAEPEGLDHNWVSCFGYRPATAEAILRHWVRAESRLVWIPGCRLLEIGRSGDRLTRLRVATPEGEQGLSFDCLIDGSDRGDTFPLAGVAHRWGWEPHEAWQEPSAPAAADLARDPFFAAHPIQSPTWVVMGQLTGVAPPSAPLLPMPDPFAGSLDRFGLERTLTYGRLPEGMVMLNWPLQGNDWGDGLQRAFSEDPAQEQELALDMQRHSTAFAAALEAASGGWVSPAGCFPDPEPRPGGVPEGVLHGRHCLALMPYWREGRRLIGRELLTEQQLLPQDGGCAIAPLPRDREGRCSAVAVGNYANDHHYPGRDWPLAAKSCRWGGRWTGTPFTVPLGALISAEVGNLLVADKAISVSHIANGATRLQPLVMNIGQVAGLVAGLSVSLEQAPADLGPDLVQRALIEDPQAPAGPFPLWQLSWHDPRWRESQLSLIDRPERLTEAGLLEDLPQADPVKGESEPLERLLRGRLLGSVSEGYALETSDGPLPVITLEPGLDHWLRGLEAPRPVELVGCLNPAGPWLRASRLVG